MSNTKVMTQYNINVGGEVAGAVHSTEEAFLLLTQWPHVRFSELVLMLLRFIDGAG